MIVVSPNNRTSKAILIVFRILISFITSNLFFSFTLFIHSLCGNGHRTEHLSIRAPSFRLLHGDLHTDIFHDQPLSRPWYWEITFYETIEILFRTIYEVTSTRIFAYCNTQLFVAMDHKWRSSPLNDIGEEYALKSESWYMYILQSGCPIDHMVGYFDYRAYRLVLAAAILAFIHSFFLIMYYVLPLDQHGRKVVPGPSPPSPSSYQLSCSCLDLTWYMYIDVVLIFSADILIRRNLDVVFLTRIPFKRYSLMLT